VAQAAGAGSRRRQQAQHAGAAGAAAAPHLRQAQLLLQARQLAAGLAQLAGLRLQLLPQRPLLLAGGPCRGPGLCQL
jgi:hypothetical protein